MSIPPDGTRLQRLVVQDPYRQPLMRTHRYKRGRSCRPPTSSSTSSVINHALLDLIKFGIGRAKAAWSVSQEIVIAHSLDLNRSRIMQRLRHDRLRRDRLCNQYAEVDRRLGPIGRVRVRYESALPKGNTYISVNRNFHKPDDKKLRFIPYFGDDDVGGFPSCLLVLEKGSVSDFIFLLRICAWIAKPMTAQMRATPNWMTRPSTSSGT